MGNQCLNPTWIPSRTRWFLQTLSCCLNSYMIAWYNLNIFAQHESTKRIHIESARDSSRVYKVPTPANSEKAWWSSRYDKLDLYRFISHFEYDIFLPPYILANIAISSFSDPEYVQIPSTMGHGLEVVSYDSKKRRGLTLYKFVQSFYSMIIPLLPSRIFPTGFEEHGIGSANLSRYSRPLHKLHQVIVV